MKVIHITGLDKKGGRSSSIIDFIAESKNAGVENIIISTTEGWIKEEATIRNFPCKIIKKPWMKTLQKMFPDSEKTVFHYHDSAVYKFIPPKDKKKPDRKNIIVSLHDYNWEQRSFPRRKKLRNGDLFIASSKHERNLARDIPIPAQDVFVVPKPVFLKRFNIMASPQPVLSRLNVPPEISTAATE